MRYVFVVFAMLFAAGCRGDLSSLAQDGGSNEPLLVERGGFLRADGRYIFAFGADAFVAVGPSEPLGGRLASALAPHEVAVGAVTACFLELDGRVSCVPNGRLRLPPALSDASWTSVASVEPLCLVRADPSVGQTTFACTEHQLGEFSPTVVTQVQDEIVSASAMGTLACGLARSGKVYCNVRSTATSSSTVSVSQGLRWHQVAEIQEAVAIGVRFRTACVASRHSVVCLGDWRLNAPPTIESLLSERQEIVIPGGPISELTLGENGGGCATTEDHEAYCWGGVPGAPDDGEGWPAELRCNSFQLTFVRPNLRRAYVRPFEEPPPIARVASGVRSLAFTRCLACAITVADELRCWGKNSYEDLGDRYPPGAVTTFESAGRVTRGGRIVPVADDAAPASARTDASSGRP